MLPLGNKCLVSSEQLNIWILSAIILETLGRPGLNLITNGKALGVGVDEGSLRAYRLVLGIVSSLSLASLIHFGEYCRFCR